MTREEAIVLLSMIEFDHAECCLNTWYKGIDDDMKEALDMAIKELEQEPKTGYWIDTGSGQECSKCHEIQYGYDNHRLYCANCGSRNIPNSTTITDAVCIVEPRESEAE